MWVDGVQQTLANEGNLVLNSFDTTDPEEVVIGHRDNTTSSLDGPLQNVIFYNGVPSTQIRESISTYLRGVLF